MALLSAAGLLTKPSATSGAGEMTASARFMAI